MFTETLWNEWVTKESDNYTLENSKRTYLKKGYFHFDHRFWFPERKEELLALMKNNLKILNTETKKLQWYPFTPFVKLLLKTPRYRYQEEEGLYDLECKIRPICYASHFDSLILGFYAFGLNKKYQDYIKHHKFDEAVLAYRSDTGKCNIQYSKDVFDEVKKFNTAYGGCTAIALDIKGYFDNINHEVLKEKWTTIWRSRLPDDQFYLFKILTKYSYVSKFNLYKKYGINEAKMKRQKTFPQTLFGLVPGATIQLKYQQLRQDRLIVENKPTKKKPIASGVPQGSAISALLSNIYLIDYDQTMVRRAEEEGFIYKRYCDDIIIICKTSQSNELKKFAISEIKNKYHLTIQDKKAEVIDFLPNSKKEIRSFRRHKQNPTNPVNPNASNERALYKNLQYLGFEFNGQNTYIRPSSLSRYFRKMKAKLEKTVDIAYGKKGKGKKIRKFQLYEKYTHLGKQNFIAYAKRAARKEYRNNENELKYGHNSVAIKKQLSRHMNLLNKALAVKNKQKNALKHYHGKKTVLKST